MIRKLFLCLCTLLVSTSMVFAQKEISGKISDASGPLPGASVVVKGTSNGTTTDFDGNYTISVPDTDTVLIFSFLGYINQEVTVGGQTTINITLVEDSQALDEVVVTALGFKENRDDVASTYSVIGAEDMLRAKEPTLINSLAGKAAGVNITGSSADPGAGSRIQIRGVSSINGSDPLIVVDGIPINNSNLEGFGSDSDAGVSQQSRLNDINPDDIETIQVFKGASAGAIYGSRALGGVIVITTKRGKAGKLKASVGSTVSIDQINRKHPLQTAFGQGSGGRYNPTNANSWGDRIADRTGGVDAFNTTGQYFEAADGSLYYPIASGSASNPHGGKNSTDVFTNSNFDQVFNNGMSQDTKISLSGGTENATFYFGASHLDQEGVMKESDYFKNTLSFGTTYKFNEWLNTSAKISYTNSSSNRIQQGSNTAGLYLGLLRNPADFDISDYIGTYYDSNGNPTPLRHRSYRRYLGNTANPTYNNPLWTIYEQTSDSEVDRFLGSVDFNITATPWLRFVVRGGLDNFNDDRTYFQPMFSGDGANNGRYKNEIYNNTEISADLISLMSFDITEDLHTNLTFGAAINDRSRKQIYVEAIDFLYNSRLQNPSVAGIIDTQERNRKIRNVRFYGQSAFEYKDLLNLNVGLTYEDASSSSKSIVYPSAELGLKWSNLLELDNESALSFGKLRLAYGEVGLAPDPHAWETGYETSTYTSYSDPISLTAFGGGFRLNDDQGNPDLEFEKKREFEVGLDLRFFKNRLSLSGTYYYNNTRDMILNVSLDPSSGYDSFLGNIGELENKGIEIEFDYKFLKKQDINLSLYGNYASNKNKMLDLKGFPGPVFSAGSSVSSTALVGEAVGILTGTAALRNADGSFDLDINGFPQLDPSGDKIIGDPNPDYTGALGIKASYKNLALNVLFETSQGHDIAERTRFVLYGFGTHADVGKEVTLSQDMVNVQGTVFSAGTTVRGNVQDFGAGPVLLDESWYTSIGGGLGSSIINEFSIGDASWTRLREISLAYTLNGDFIKKTGLESISLSATGRNLVLWTNVDGIDPDISQFSGLGKGLDYFTNPSSKSFVFGITINY